MALDQAWIILIILPIILVGLVGLFAWGKKKATTISNTVLVSNLKELEILPEYRKQVKRYHVGLGFASGLIILGMLSLSIVAAKPVTVESVSETKYNRDITLCLDVSGSMASVDYEILEKFQKMLKDFKGERISLVVWNSSSHMVFPLTDDYDYVEKNLELVSNWFYQPSGETETTVPDEYYDLYKYTLNNNGGSLIGDGLTACGLVFNSDDSSDERSKSIILATDNVVNGEPLIGLGEAMKFITGEGITVYGIRPTTGYELGEEATEMREQIENVNNGVYYDAEDSEAVPGIVMEISETEATAIEAPPVVVKNSTPDWWIGGSVLLILAGFGLMWRFKV